MPDDRPEVDPFEKLELIPGVTRGRPPLADAMRQMDCPLSSEPDDMPEGRSDPEIIIALRDAAEGAGYSRDEDKPTTPASSRRATRTNAAADALLGRFIALREELAAANRRIRELEAGRLRVIVTRRVVGIGCVASPGEYAGEMNPQGAVSAVLPDGKRLGLMPGEFRFKGWEEARAMEGDAATVCPRCKASEPKGGDDAR